MSEIKCALVSVSDKRNLTTLVRELNRLGIDVIATDGTAKILENEGLLYQSVSKVTGFPEILGGRLKTLHPTILGGLLGRPDSSDDMLEMRERDIKPIGLLVCNLYPFEETIQQKNITTDDAMEQIDIGGPTMIRSAAKNFKHVSVVIDPDDYETIIHELKENNNCISLDLRKRLAKKVFEHTYRYDEAIFNYMRSIDTMQEDFPFQMHLELEKVADLRYGTNPHQKAAVYKAPDVPGLSLVDTAQLQGNILSYNNYLDLNAALSIINEFTSPTAAVIKHTIPAGCALGNSIRQAYQRAYSCDPVSAYGGILGFNRMVDKELAHEIDQMKFFEAIIAPDYSNDALLIFTKRKNCRIVKYHPAPLPNKAMELQTILGGILIQQMDFTPLDESLFQAVTEVPVPDELKSTLLFSFKIVKYVKSNAIVIAKNEATVGIGTGQPSRVDSVRIAIRKAGVHAKGAVLASDAFFPFEDSIEEAKEAGIAAIIQPGGSIRDKEVIEACNRVGIPMIFTQTRYFRH